MRQPPGFAGALQTGMADVRTQVIMGPQDPCLTCKDSAKLCMRAGQEAVPISAQAQITGEEVSVTESAQWHHSRHQP